MTVKELKEALNKFDDNLEIVVQYRDGGGNYSGADKDLFLCQASVDGDKTYYYNYIYYGDNDSGKKVIVL